MKGGHLTLIAVRAVLAVGALVAVGVAIAVDQNLCQHVDLLILEENSCADKRVCMVCYDPSSFDTVVRESPDSAPGIASVYIRGSNIGDEQHRRRRRTGRVNQLDVLYLELCFFYLGRHLTHAAASVQQHIHIFSIVITDNPPQPIGRLWWLDQNCVPCDWEVGWEPSPIQPREHGEEAGANQSTPCPSDGVEVGGSWSHTRCTSLSPAT